MEKITIEHFKDGDLFYFLSDVCRCCATWHNIPVNDVLDAVDNGTADKLDLSAVVKDFYPYNGTETAPAVIRQETELVSFETVSGVVLTIESGCDTGHIKITVDFGRDSTNLAREILSCWRDPRNSSDVMAALRAYHQCELNRWS